MEDIYFFIICVIAFFILFRIGMALITYSMQPNMSPHLIDGTVNASQLLVFPQDPNKSGSVPIYRSVNQREGIEFTWSVWIYINDIQASVPTYRHIFSKGNSTMGTNGIIQPNNAPGLYLVPNKNELLLIVNTYNTINEEINVPDIPLNKWLHVAIRCKGKVVDVYINGVVYRSITLSGVPKQNYGEVFVAMNGGFDGLISNLWYYNYAVPTKDLQQLVTNGPNTKMINGSGGGTMYNYLSSRWFY